MMLVNGSGTMSTSIVEADFVSATTTDMTIGTVPASSTCHQSPLVIALGSASAMPAAWVTPSAACACWACRR